MTKITSLSTIAAALLAFGLSAAPAAALANRTWVSGTGTDTGACSRTAPCRTFAFAITLTNAGGEIDVLDPAGYGAVTITKAISIVNDGVGVAGIKVGGGFASGVTIKAGASDSVHLRGLTIEGLGSLMSTGIVFNKGGNLAIENCVIRFVGGGITIFPSTPSSFSVSNTIASNNLITGIGVSSPPSVAVTGVLSKVITNNNGSGSGGFVGGITVGLIPSGALNVTIVDSVASNNANGFGIVVTGGAATQAMVRNSVASNNMTGLEAEGSGAGGAVLRVAHSVVTGNATGVNTSNGGTLFSYGDNDIDGNTNNNYGALTKIPPH